MNKQLKYYNLLALVCLTFIFISCGDDDYALPSGGKDLQNDCIKRSLGPNLVENKIEFAYAMALPPEKGKIVSAKVNASIAGADGTYLEHNSFYTNGSGVDVGIKIGDPSVTNGTLTEVIYTKDTCAATLRYYYVIPEEARGKDVSFTFSATDSNGKTVSYKMGSYHISNMDIKLDMVVNSDSYLSIADMEVYTNSDMPAKADKVDLVYLYRRISGISFLHALVSPGADSEYLPDVTLPAGATNITPSQKTYGAIDQQLARDQYGVFIDDLDLQKINLTNAPDFSINLKKDSGLWVETADGQYKAFIYVNKIDNGRKSMTISLKRLKVR